MFHTPDDHVCMTLYDFTSRYIGVKEVAGNLDNPLIMAMLKLTPDGTWTGWPKHDEVPWCSGLINWGAWHLRLPRSKSLLARSWLNVGRPISLEEAQAKNDILIFKRGGGDQPGPEDLAAPGHVALFSGLEGDWILALGGNQGNAISIQGFPGERLLGVRRLLG